MRYTSRWILGAAVSAALLLGATATSHAQSMASSGTPIVTGGGHWLIPPDMFSPGFDTIGFSVSAVMLPDGSASGSGASYRHGVHSMAGLPAVIFIAGFQFDVTESMPWDGGQAVLGVITSQQNTPFPVGNLVVLLIQDNDQGGGTTDTAISASGLPPVNPMTMLPLTLADILPGAPPSSFWFPLVGGNFKIH
jgi:hypothetical protein